MGAAGAALLSTWPGLAWAEPTSAPIERRRTGAWTLSYRPYTLEMRHVFTLATSSRSTTPVMLTRLEFDGVSGYGEASMPPYLGESQQSAAAFLARVDLGRFRDPFAMDDILAYVDGLAPGNTAAKASVDIALHDLVGRLMKQPWYRIWGYSPEKTPYTSFTIGLDKPDVVRQKTREASSFRVLKVKLGRQTDREMIESIRSVTDTPICVDVNQGWKDRSFALDMIHWLAERRCIFVEQPLPKEQVDDLAWLTQRSPLPIVGDEGVQRLADLPKAHGVYSGINIKLMKCTGMREAHKMLEVARSLGMKVMIGCMTETSCAISAASQLSPMVDWADLDGALLIRNDAFEGTTVVDGKVTLGNLPGIGVRPTGRCAF